jgi:hypothetical protein
MVAFTRDEVRAAYGIDLHALQEDCPDALIGVVTPNGVFWRGDPKREPPPSDAHLIEIVRSRGVEECLFLLLEGPSREALERHCGAREKVVEPYWIPLRRRACCMLVRDPRVRPPAPAGGPARPGPVGCAP